MSEDRRPKRRCVQRKALVPSAVHYVGYVEEDETPEMIMKKFEALADGIADAAAAIFIERKRPEAQQSADWITRQRSKIDTGLATLNTMVEGPWCMGTAFTLADIAAGSTLGYLAFRFPEIDWRGQYSALAALHARLSERESFKATVPQA